MQTTADNLKKREYVVLDLCLLIDLRGFRYLANGEEKTVVDIVIIANNDRRAAAVAFLIDPRVQSLGCIIHLFPLSLYPLFKDDCFSSSSQPPSPPSLHHDRLISGISTDYPRWNVVR